VATCRDNAGANLNADTLLIGIRVGWPPDGILNVAVTVKPATRGKVGDMSVFVRA
jgi:hypothetical protein